LKTYYKTSSILAASSSPKAVNAFLINNKNGLTLIAESLSFLYSDICISESNLLTISLINLPTSSLAYWLYSVTRVSTSKAPNV
jgi:hypothetical protein